MSLIKSISGIRGTIGGKAFGKTIALKRSKDILLLVGVFLSIFKKRAQTND